MSDSNDNDNVVTTSGRATISPLIGGDVTFHLTKKEEEEEEDILEYVEKELSNIDTGNIYKYINDNMSDELEQLMSEYKEESKDMTENEKHKCHKIFTRLGILQKIKIDCIDN